MITLFLAGVRAETLSVRIWNSLLLEVEPIIAAAGTLLIGVTVLALLLDWGVRRLRARDPVSI
jgi:ABC-type spermidine/putrescine transport system permease subunit II